MSEEKDTLPPALEQLLDSQFVDGWRSLGEVSCTPSELEEFMVAAYDLGIATSREESREETNLVTDAVEAVAERQMNNSADAAVFAVLSTLGVVEVEIDFDRVRTLIANHVMTKSYLPNGNVTFKLDYI